MSNTHNPQKCLAEFKNEYMGLRKEQYPIDRFATVFFAILDDHNAHLAHNPEGNYAPFAREFGA